MDDNLVSKLLMGKKTVWFIFCVLYKNICTQSIVYNIIKSSYKLPHVPEVATLTL